ncbi:hypothetical protein ASPACDRAFT_117422 [Aspergillus aculeatus ATCC 16872]|uniref:Mitotic checkpoint regulator, MAD2B-interacting-domain-containing protein n=1 Tax=Aspergillus aculeatus (strain ATCC 16872 / CBS 172.66 / WB 5094) TaxID=690307 RepID=A0A1L9WXK7_ASPA1|nr:uncharacterized protein ASPACDRAFT_117422 [Aspergillus aculeatus ATCC 16872]OJK00873.1 hypothetical protein ASPACDRAFT_117422 [Aspergillus aculeatus ATCC 16872]
MALVAYSDSEASDSEPETTTTTTTTTTTKKPTSTAPAPALPSTITTTTTTSSTTPKPFQIDRSNPRKIRVALPDLKPDTSTNEDTDGPARKKPRIGGGGGGAFAGFNALLPAPKKPAVTPKPSATGSTRKVFSLKTGATPGFDRQADAEMRSEMAFGRLGEDETIPKAGSLRGDNDDILGEGEGGQGKNEGSKANMDTKPPPEVKLKGNPMMFKPLSVGRGTQGKGKRKAGPIAVTGSGGASGPLKKDLGGGSSAGAAAGVAPPVAAAAPAPAPAPPKPKISLFSLSSSTEETVTAPAPAPAAYEPLVYTSTQEATAPAGPEPPAAAPELAHPSYPPTSTTTGNTTLSAIADDLNLTRAQRRQLFGRSADPSGPAATAAAPRVLHFNTDREYAANQQMAHEDLAAAQHNPVRAIAPGKHTLQQLVSAASTQREALEESFATGRRNKKEAGSKYGW